MEVGANNEAGSTFVLPQYGMLAFHFISEGIDWFSMMKQWLAWDSRWTAGPSWSSALRYKHPFPDANQKKSGQ